MRSDAGSSLRRRKEIGDSNPNETTPLFFRGDFTVAVAEQGARANDHSRHASCVLILFRMKLPTRNPNLARVAPAVIAAHL